MSIFDWNTLWENIPDTWRATKGKGIKIAILDSGADLHHAALAHVNQPGHKFDATLPNATQSQGNDDIRDVRPRGNDHGTRCLSIMAAKGTGVVGMATEAEYFVIKTADTDAAAKQTYLLDGLRIAARLDADVVVSATTPRRIPFAAAAAVDEVFEAIRDKKIAFVSVSRNRDILAEVNELVFPATRPEAIVAGSLSPSVLSEVANGGLLAAGIHVSCAQSCSTRTVTSLADEVGILPSSYANAALGGLIALYLSQLKAEQGGSYQRPSREALLAALRPAFLTGRPDNRLAFFANF